MRIGIDWGSHFARVVLVAHGRILQRESGAPDTESVAALVSLVCSRQPKARQQVRSLIVAPSRLARSLELGRGLTPTAVVRLTANGQAGVAPFQGWPAQVLETRRTGVFVCNGARELDSPASTGPDPGELAAVAARLRTEGFRSAAVTSLFSPLDATAERMVGSYLHQHVPGLRFTLSHSLGSIGLLERENGAILNALLVDEADALATEIRHVAQLARLRVAAYVARHDGTAADIEHVRVHPITAVGARAAAAARGAVQIAGVTDAIVVRLHDDRCEVTAVRQGYPVRADTSQRLLGVPTALPQIDSRTVAFDVGTGGGQPSKDAALLELVEAAGRTSIVASRSGRAATDRRRVASRLLDDIERRLAAAVAEARGVDADLPVVLVGAASPMIRLPEERQSVTRLGQDQAEFAAALGAATAGAGGECDRLFSQGFMNAATRPHDDPATSVLDEAVLRAVAAGARMSSIRPLEQSESPVSYLPFRAVRVRARVVGDLMGEYDPHEVADTTPDVDPSLRWQR